MALVPSPALCAQPLISALGPVPKAFKPFWPPALVQQEPPAIILAVLRRFRGSALLRGLCPSSSQGAPFLAFGSNSALKRTGFQPAAYLGR